MRENPGTSEEFDDVREKNPPKDGQQRREKNEVSRQGKENDEKEMTL